MVAAHAGATFFFGFRCGERGWRKRSRSKGGKVAQYGKPKSSAAQFPASRFVNTVEALENFCLIFIRDADSGIPDCDYKVVACLRECKFHASGWRSVFKSVVEENVGEPGVEEPARGARRQALALCQQNLAVA